MARSASLRSHLQRLYDAQGILTAEIVVEDAKDPNSPLHHRFEWDNAEAARKYRLQQATELIRSARIVYAADGESRRDVRAFGVSRVGTPGAYRPMEALMADPMEREIQLREAQRDVQAFQRRYSHLAEYAELVASLTKEQAG